MTAALLPQWRDDWALFLDVDGTLLKIAAAPDAVSVPQRLIDLLAKLGERLGGALALVSGRLIVDIDGLFAPLRLPVAGAHGAERRAASGRLQRRDDSDALVAAKRRLAEWTAAHPGTLLEDKGSALALHYRQAPAFEAAAKHAVADALLAAGPDFHLQEGKKVLEIRADGVGKGRAIAAFMSEPPFAGRLPVFVGDDLTDEAGFETVNRLGGHSIAVGVDRATHAKWHLADEASVVAWLEASLGEPQ